MPEILLPFPPWFKLDGLHRYRPPCRAGRPIRSGADLSGKAGGPGPAGDLPAPTAGRDRSQSAGVAALKALGSLQKNRLDPSSQEEGFCINLNTTDLVLI